jgi:abortive infection bacteriophage resistance protein
MRTTAGCLFMGKEKYKKPRLSIDEQIQLLKQQGLKIENVEDVRHVIKVVGYYRFSGYLHPFKSQHKKDSRRNFHNNVTFDSIWQLYQFDRELRLLVSDAIEKIEVAFRASISDVTSDELGLFWYIDKGFYRNQSLYEKFMQKIDAHLRHPEEVFIQHYLEKYNDPKYPPIWMMIEALSFGECSKLFSNIQSIAIRNKVSEIFQQHTTIIESWMKVIVSIRNICAHHSRLWNRWLVEAPIIPKIEPLHGYLLNHNRKFIVCTYIIIKLLQSVVPKNHWKNNLYDLLDKYNQFPGLTMGFSKEWKNDPIWKL